MTSPGLVNCNIGEFDYKKGFKDSEVIYDSDNKEVVID